MTQTDDSAIDAQEEDIGSCLVQQLTAYDPLDALSLQSLAELEKDQRTIFKGKDVPRDEIDGEHLFVVRRGWFYSYSDMVNGNRQITSIHLPGDLIGYRNMTDGNALTTLRAAENGVICPFPKSGLTTIFNNTPRLAALLHSVSNRNHISLITRLNSVGQMKAYVQIIFLLLELRARLKVANPHLTDRIRVPLTQTEIGSILGITNVRVSQTLSDLKRNGLIEQSGQWFIFKEELKLAALTGFVDRYATLDTAWLPDPSEALKP